MSFWFDTPHTMYSDSVVFYRRTSLTPPPRRYRTGPARRLGLFRRVQPDQHRSAVGRGATDTVHLLCSQGRRDEIHVRGPRDRPATDVRHIHHHEPRVRRPDRAARQSEIDVPRHIDGGAGHQANRGDHVVRRGFPGHQESGQQGARVVPAVPAAAQQAGPLRVRAPRLGRPVALRRPVQTSVLEDAARRRGTVLARLSSDPLPPSPRKHSVRPVEISLNRTFINLKYRYTFFE